MADAWYEVLDTLACRFNNIRALMCVNHAITGIFARLCRMRNVNLHGRVERVDDRNMYTIEVWRIGVLERRTQYRTARKGNSRECIVGRPELHTISTGLYKLKLAYVQCTPYFEIWRDDNIIGSLQFDGRQVYSTIIPTSDTHDILLACKEYCRPMLPEIAI